MNQPSKVLMIVTAAGILLGAGLSQYVSPSMKFASEADWRDRYRTAYSDTSMQFVDAGPIDLAPSMPWLGATGVSDQEPYSYYKADYADYLSDEALLGAEEPLDPVGFVESDKSAPQVEQAVTQASATAAQLEKTDTQAQRANRMVSQNSFNNTEPEPPRGDAYAL